MQINRAMILSFSLAAAASVVWAVPPASTVSDYGVLNPPGSSIVFSGNQTAATPPEFPMAAGLRKPHAPPKPGELRVMEIKELGNFDYDPEKGGLPDDVKALSGLKVQLRGYMAPLEQGDKISEFLLVPSLTNCCYGQPPQMQHTITCTTAKGLKVPYSPDVVNVVGTLKVEEKKDEGFIISIFQLTVTQVTATDPSAKK
jgi:hypothetical protein